MKKICFILLCFTVTWIFHAYAAEDWLAWFDPEEDGRITAKPPEGPVTVTFNFARKTKKINDQFYGINSHPLPAEEAFRNPELIRELKPDTVRIMTNHRTYWYRENGQSKVTRTDLSPERGRFNWESVDDLVKAIHGFGAEPYIAIGFGAPRWLNTSNAPKLGRPLRDDLPEYADYITSVAKHLVELNCGVKYVTVDNEPENVAYPIDDYMILYRNARTKLREAVPGIKIAGPTTGYAWWTQPDGKKISFSSSLQIFRDEKIVYDAIDWHVYSTNPSTILKTADMVAKTYPGTPRFLTEFNLDWRYTGQGGEKSETNNTGWNSVRWLALVWDELQMRGVDRTYYFCFRNKYFGLCDYWLEETRPAYHLFRFFTRGLGRQRIAADSSHPSVGVIATVSNDNGRSAILYNLADVPVALKITNWSGEAELSVLSREWYEENKQIRDGRAADLSFQPVDLGSELSVPAGGAILLKQCHPEQR